MRPVPTCILTSADAPEATDGHDLDRYVQIGSLTKPLTATVLTRLAEAGDLQLDDRIEQFLPAPSGTGITLRHLAAHTSGLPRLPPHLHRRDPYAPFDAQALDALVRRLDTLPTTAPGDTEEYSNLGYAVLGAALASATGTAYEDLLARHVLAPLGITEISVSPPPQLRLHRTGMFGRPVRPWTMDGAILPAGGLWATPRAAARLTVDLLVEQKLGEPTPFWQTAGPLRWHNGATRDASVFTGALPDGTWVLVHRLSGNAEQTDEIGIAQLRNIAAPKAS
jgi:D-alanyl-D-alanine-carboxypeptidase/D-alanyl-D-alanine-endopeptidase